MTIDKKSLGIIGIMLLAFWLSFIFLDGTFSDKAGTVERSVEQIQEAVPASSENLDTIAAQLDISEASSTGLHQAAADVNFSQETQSGSLDLVKQQSLMEDIHALQFLYDKNTDPNILPLLIQRLASAYQFADANRYLKQLMAQPNYEKSMDVRVILYVLFHADDVTMDTSTSVQKLLPLIEQYRTAGLLTADDYSFYRGLLLVRSQKYNEANQSWSSLSMSSPYASIVSAYTKALKEYSGSLHAPAYYQDALVALSMLKNGYFSVAKKLALSAIMKNEDYVLPYQILAYANFLSSNWDVAADYFLKLTDFDKINTDRYTFLVGVSYYRQGKYEQSLLYLNQVTDTGMLTDVYRYQLLSSLGIEDTDAAVRIRQKLLGQSDVQDSDFMQFFTSIFYQPYVNAQPFTIYQANPQLVSLYQDACSRLATSKDVCTYGEVGQSLSTSTWTGIADKLLYLSSTYHQSFLSHVVGDYYFQNKEYRLAKDAYSKALSNVTSSNELSLLQAKLQKVLDAE